MGLFALLGLAFSAAAWAIEPFKIEQIRAEGLQRLELGTVLSYLPLAVGDELNDQTSRQAIRALYASGLFQDVELLRDGDVLVVRVQERPAISSFSIDGNEKIGGDKLKESLKEIGLAEGEPFKKALLDQVEQELRRQYYANGFYDVEIATDVKDEPGNRVSLKIKVTEGRVTHIKDINILGNKAFTKEELLEQLKLEPTDWVPFQKSDRYSKQQLLGDLESLTSYYQDRGYLKFSVSSVQVALSPDKEDIYITVNLEEGDVYRIKNRRFAGETIVNEDFLYRLISTPEGSVFSRKEATESANRIEAALADIGYAFAEVQPIPEVDEAAKEVSLVYQVQPGRRAYVRRISFAGNASTNDETLRREMRQLEASPFSKSAVERSRVRLARLPFIEEVEVETKPVPGSDDLVDVAFTVKERPPGSVQLGVGYSGASGFLVTGSLTHTNFFGTGNRVELSLDNNTLSRAVSFSWTDPYFTEDGISQSVSAYYRQSEGLTRLASGFRTNAYGASLTYGIPLSEYTTLRAGGGIEDIAVSTFPGSSSDELLEFVVANGARFLNYKLRSGITRDTRNRTIFADRGALDQFNVDLVVPGSDLQYLTATFRHQHYQPLFAKLFAEFNANIGWVQGYGGDDPPPYENLFAGGTRTVRGFREGSLGPRDNFDNPFGGRFRTTLQNEIVIPTPMESDGKSTRLSAFYDIGNTFADAGDWTFSDLRQSYGIAFTWFTPFLGILELSYAFPLAEQPDDETDRFQITFGAPF
ncbi:MAG: outer membrane protein assembly factor BamA [Gammaproteobacteria bacterium]|nr:outer membrane protein assembly factor BamA [Gammaproteobacteria bacterium]